MTVETFDASTTWTVPAGVTSVDVAVHGGGAGSCTFGPAPDYATGNGGAGGTSSCLGLSATGGSETQWVYGGTPTRGSAGTGSGGDSNYTGGAATGAAGGGGAGAGGNGSDNSGSTGGAGGAGGTINSPGGAGGNDTIFKGPEATPGTTPGGGGGGGSGACGGGCAVKYGVAVTPGASVTVTVGAAGAAAYSGTNGGGGRVVLSYTASGSDTSPQTARRARKTWQCGVEIARYIIGAIAAAPASLAHV